ncbi:MAG: hypothetical protein ABEJ42_03485 [Halobacteriaceae archaeon]
MWVHRYDPTARRYHGALFFDDGNGSGWGLSEVFVGEAVTASRLAETPRPGLDAPVRDAGGVERTATLGAYGAGGEGVVHVEDADELRVTNATTDRVVLATPDAGSYADLHGLSESRVGMGSHFRSVIDRDSGRLVRVVDHRRLRRDDGETDGRHVVWTLSYGGRVERPGWVARGPFELLFDAVTV